MLNIQRCLYGILYSNIESGNADKAISQENVTDALTEDELSAQVATTLPSKMRDDLVMDDGWVYIEEAAESVSGRSSPVMVQGYELEECSSTASSENSKVLTSSQKKSFKQSESYHRAKFLSSKRAHLEQKAASLTIMCLLFEDVPRSEKEKIEDIRPKARGTNGLSANKLKRSQFNMALIKRLFDRKDRILTPGIDLNIAKIIASLLLIQGPVPLAILLQNQRPNSAQRNRVNYFRDVIMIASATI
uniref:Uncharacterized protein n=1 Tax=Syphacia muris TaxID=451379 RepID=A0A0N5AUR4_9BILA